CLITTVEVFLLDETSEADAEILQNKIRKNAQVASVEYISKSQAMTEMRNRLGDSAYLLDTLADNPLPASLRVRLSDLSYGAAVRDLCQSMDGVEDVRFYADEVSKVITITNTIQKGAWIIIAFLIIVSIVVVSNTIKITVMARQDELVIMQYVGATNWFIRGPLLCEGVIIGLISAAVSLGLASLVYIRFYDMFSQQALILFTSGLVVPAFIIQNFAWIFVALGVSIGSFGSIISMRKFLQA
ncbi:MAG: ABC transporter permease, partial [Clostridia bacterium]|nr:ABC transporter permease [Clostridia bacterium]